MSIHMLDWCFDVVGLICQVYLFSNIKFSCQSVIWIRVYLIQMFFVSVDEFQVIRYVNNLDISTLAVFCQQCNEEREIDSLLTASACNKLPLPSHPPYDVAKCTSPAVDSTHPKFIWCVCVWLIHLKLLLSICLCCLFQAHPQWWYPFDFMSVYLVQIEQIWQDLVSMLVVLLIVAWMILLAIR